MKAFIVLLLVLSARAHASFFGCEIFIPGDGISKAGNMYSVEWNAQLELHQAAESMGRSLQRIMNLCRRPAILRAHGYGAVVAYYILALGNRFHELFPNHPYIQIFDQTIVLYSFNGAFKGSPLMDQMCAGQTVEDDFEGVLGRKCILSLTSSPVYHADHEVSSPGVLVYVISSTSSEHISERSKEILDNFGLSLEEIGEYRNLNDGVIPLYSSLACSQGLVMTGLSDHCTKINDIFFKDLVRLEDYGHFQIYNDEQLLEIMSNEMEH